MRKLHTLVALPLFALALSTPLYAQYGQTKPETAPAPTPSAGMPGSGTSTKQGMDEDSGAIKQSRNSPGQADARSKKEVTIKGAAAAPNPSGAGSTNLKTRSDAVNADAGVSLTGSPVTRPDKVTEQM